ncbi:MAG: Copper chaperone CopZ [Gemmatimonadetes bacterium]|nr:Copper chaperone CopZ [Gemmatimonadota bacterium]
MAEIALEIRGMTCSHCVSHVKKAIEKAGATASDVRVGSARVEIPEGSSTGAVIAAIGDAGYPAFEAT